MTRRELDRHIFVSAVCRNKYNSYLSNGVMCSIVDGTEVFQFGFFRSKFLLVLYYIKLFFGLVPRVTLFSLFLFLVLPGYFVSKLRIRLVFYLNIHSIGGCCKQCYLDRWSYRPTADLRAQLCRIQYKYFKFENYNISYNNKNTFALISVLEAKVTSNC